MDLYKHPEDPIEVLVVDIDNTVYVCPGYTQAGHDGEDMEVAKLSGRTVIEVQTHIARFKAQQKTRSEAVFALGITKEQWDSLRCRVWQPERFLIRNPGLVTCIEELSRVFRIVFCTNSPREIGRRILAVTGINPTFSLFGPEDTGTAKHDPEFFTYVAQQMEVGPAKCFSIGDRAFVDGRVPVLAGYGGAMIVSGPNEIISEKDMILQFRQKGGNTCRASATA